MSDQDWDTRQAGKKGERILAPVLLDHRADAISAEAARFADRMAAVYLPGGGGTDWRNEVMAIHDPAHVLVLLQEAVDKRLLAKNNTNLVPEAARAQMDPEGQQLELMARIGLSDPDMLEAVAVHLRRDKAQGAEILAVIDSLIKADGVIDATLAAGMNRELAFARGFSEAGGFGFPTSLDDVAADLNLQISELRSESSARIELTYYAAFASLGVVGVGHVALARETPESHWMRTLIAQAEAEVLDQLAVEAGRAAARRQKGNAL
ncbi:MAG: hypothetical protein ACK5II_04080 [Paracoccus sp. (in: a-proteobacteria)]